MDGTIMDGREVIASLKANLADLTYALYSLRNEYNVIAQSAEDEKDKEDINRANASLVEANEYVIKLYYEIDSNEAQMESELYNDEARVKNLRNEVDRLNLSIRTFIAGNKNLLDNITK